VSGSGLTIVTSDGVRLVYDDDGAGVPVVLIHSYSGNRGHWTFQRRALLDSGYRVIAIDLRGHGDSDQPAFGLRMSRYGQDVHELLEELELDEAIVVGHSFGVAVLWAMLSLYGTQRIGKFVSIDHSPKIINDEDWRWGLRKVEWENVWESVNFRFAWGNAELEPARPAHVQAAFPDMDAKFDSFPHPGLRPILLDHFVADWRDVLPRIDVPTWVVTSKFSPFYDLGGMEWLASEVQDGTLAVFEHSGHYPQLNEPDEFNKQLLSFLAP
jgi:pimeloyl-ACP methyl ester carboxylesterase